MVNKEFQELKRQFSVRERPLNDIFVDMQRILRERNNDGDEYTFQYTRNGSIIISKCKNFSELFEIDGDMCPRNL